MASGLLGKADLSATTNTTLYTVPAATTTSFSVNFCNRTASAVTVRLALCATSTPATTEYIIYDYSLAANTAIERTGLVLGAGLLVVAYVSAVGVTATVYGYEG